MAFVLLALGVHRGLVSPLDAAARSIFRPDNVWGPLQWHADLVVEGLRPAVIVGVTAVAVAGVTLARRSLRPVIVAAAVGGLTGLLTLGTKILLDRPAPSGLSTADGGSFPSGHTATVVACAGIVVFLVRPRARWAWLLLPTAVGGLMGAALLVQAAHWTSDVIGGGLLATAVLAAACAAGLDRWVDGPEGGGCSPGRVSEDVSDGQTGSTSALSRRTQRPLVGPMLPIGRPRPAPISS